MFLGLPAVPLSSLFPGSLLSSNVFIVLILGTSLGKNGTEISPAHILGLLSLKSLSP